jgi:uncharacterized membrane protein YuzA (DUF378 family)
MSTNAVLILQTLLIFLQMVNAGLSGMVHNPMISLILGAAVGALQFLAQHVGNQTVPPPPPAK